VKIRLKLPLALAAAMSLLLAAALFGVSTLRQSLTTYETTVSEIVDHERRVADVALQFKSQVQEWKNTLLRGRDAQARDKHWAAFQSAEGRVREQTEALLQHMAANQGRQLVERFLAAHGRMGQGYRKGHADFVAANFDPVAGDAAVAGVDREATELLVQAGNHIEALSKSVGQDAAAQGHRAVDVSLGVMLAVFAAGIVGALLFSRSITRPLQRAVGTAQDVAAGNLAQALNVKGSDETAELLRALDRMRDSLSRVVAGVRSNAEGVATASSQIAHGNQRSQRAHRTSRPARCSRPLPPWSNSAPRCETTPSSAQTGQPAGARRLDGGGARRRRRRQGGRHHAEHQRQQQQDRRHHRHHRRHRVPDQHPGAERCRGGGARRRARSWLCRGGQRSAQPGAAQRRGGQARSRPSSADSVERSSKARNWSTRLARPCPTWWRSIQRVTDIVAEISAASASRARASSRSAMRSSQMDQATQRNAALVEESMAAADSLRQQAGLAGGRGGGVPHRGLSNRRAAGVAGPWDPDGPSDRNRTCIWRLGGARSIH
jgi:HAMP domain-containing protein